MGNRIRMHLGVELDLTEQELEELCSSRCPQQLLELVQSKRCRICGSSYFTETAENGALAGWECGLPQTPMTRFFVDTPDGILAVHQVENPDYPGVAVDLKASGPGSPDIPLSLTEYIPEGEGISDYDLSHPEEMHRQQDEVPPQRRRIGADGSEEVTPGLVTRGWPNESEENHRRIFHYGYDGR